MPPNAIWRSWLRLTSMLLVALGLLHTPGLTSVMEGATVNRLEFVDLGGGGDGAVKAVQHDTIRVPRPERIHEPMHLPQAVAPDALFAECSYQGCERQQRALAVVSVLGASLVGVVELRV